VCKDDSHSLTELKTAKIKKADITFAAHCHNVNVLLSNISLFNYRPLEMRLLYFSTVGFFYFYFFFQSPSRLDLTSDCHNQYQYRKVVEVAVI